MMSEAPRQGWRLVGVGCDTESRERLARVLERRPSFLQRWYTPREQEAVARAADPLDLALRLFCLKEAAIKAAWLAERLSPRAVEGQDCPEGAQLCLTSSKGARLRLEAECGSDAHHAWAQVLCWEARC